MEKTPINIVKRIGRAILNNMLDAQFMMSVEPQLNAFSSLKTIKDQADVADIYNQGLHDALKDNHWDTIKEKVGRWGIKRFGASQVTWDMTNRAEGEIKIEDIDPKLLKWNKGAKKPEQLTWIGYVSEIPVPAAKKFYASDAEGNYNEELCKKIDQIAEASGSGDEKGQRKGVVNVSTTEGTSQAYAYDRQGIVAGRIVKLIVMFLLDDSVYAPEKKDSEKEKTEKVKSLMSYPDGRMVIMSAKKENKIVFLDRPAPEGFKNLGNIDLFNSVEGDNLVNDSDLEDIISIQCRINGALHKMRDLINGHIKALGGIKDQLPGLQENSLVRFPILFLEGLGTNPEMPLPAIVNDTMPDVAAVWGHIKELIQQAYDTVGLNPTMISGIKQPGTTSGEQEERLQESPMTTIRAYQRNFKDYCIRTAEKVIILMQKYYNTKRFIKLATGIDNATMAQIKDEGQIELFDEAGKTIRTIQLNKGWKFSINVSAGTEIPRSRRENAQLTEKLYSAGIFSKYQESDSIDIFLKDIDYPNRRAVVQYLRKMATDAAKAGPKIPKLEEILANKEWSVAFSEVMKGLEGFNQAKAQILKTMGMIESIDTIETTAAKDITSRSDVRDVASISASKVSADPQRAAHGSEMAQVIEIIKGLSPEHLAQALTMLSGLGKA